ncbi:MAG TPA: tetratricopeptide repeat protein [Terracidiphilus sp.]|jgi:protein O-GlcNAc transferase|nr:tetratricopeptide repeat protein [Terracidiphilus sp.]
MNEFSNPRSAILTLAALLALGGWPANPQSPQETPALRKADAAFRAGFAAQQSGDLETAHAQFAEAVKLAPQIAEAHEALGTVLLQLGKALDATHELETALKLQPKSSSNESNLALAYAAAGEIQKALPHFAAALQWAQQPGQPKPDPSLYDAYAQALAAVGRRDEALQEFSAEEADAGERADLEDAIGSVYAQEQQWEKARSHFEHALQLDGSFLRARIHLGILLRNQNDIDSALAALRPVADTTPPVAEAKLEYGRTLAAAGRDEDAIPQFEAALQVDPQIAGAQLDLAMALQRMGRQQEAIPLFEQVVAREPRNAGAFTNLGLALTLTGKAKEGLDDLQHAQTLDPHNAVIYKDMGVAHVQLSAFDEAIRDFQKALTLEPSDPQLHYDLGLAYKFKDRIDEAIFELQRAGEMDPTLQDPPYTLGILLMQVGKLDEAVTQLRKAVALRPENGDAWAILGSTLKQDARLSEAADALRKAIPLLPGQPGPRVTLAGVLAEEAAELATQADAAEGSGDAGKAQTFRSQMGAFRQEAATLRKDAAELARGAVSRQRASFAMNAGNQLMLRGQIADAIARYQESIAADPTFADPHAQLAIAYERQGRGEDAAAERTRAAQLSQSN